METPTQDWYRTLQTGDMVILKRGGPHPLYTTATVRITPSQIIARRSDADHLYRFLRKNGQEIAGDRWYATCLLPCTPDDQSQIDLDALRQRLVRWGQGLAVATLEHLPQQELQALWDRLQRMGLTGAPYAR